MTPRRKHSQKCRAEATITEARTKSQKDPRLFNTDEEFDRYMRYFKKGTTLPRHNIDQEFMSNFELRLSFDRMRWTPIVSLVDLVYTTLVQCFYSKAQFKQRVFIDCTLRGKEMLLNIHKICEILGAPCESLLVDDMKT